MFELLTIGMFSYFIGFWSESICTKTQLKGFESSYSYYACPIFVPGPTRTKGILCPPSAENSGGCYIEISELVRLANECQRGPDKVKSE